MWPIYSTHVEATWPINTETWLVYTETWPIYTETWPKHGRYMAYGMPLRYAVCG